MNYKFRLQHFRPNNDIIAYIGTGDEKRKIITKVRENKIKEDGTIEYVFKGKTSHPLVYDLMNKELLTGNESEIPVAYSNADEFILAILGKSSSVENIKCTCDRMALFYGGCKCGQFQRELQEENF